MAPWTEPTATSLASPGEAVKSTWEIVGLPPHFEHSGGGVTLTTLTSDA
jgi:hypothetical protein